MIYTFYSFKGGVGRTMALANVAELLYRRGFNVLIVDFDLEAPGLERFFQVPDAVNKPFEIQEKRGIIDMLISYKELCSLPRLKPNLDIYSYNHKIIAEPVTHFTIPIYEVGKGKGTLSIMPAGRRAGKFTKYVENVRFFDWDGFYANWKGEKFFDWFRQELNKIYDVILIDSRPGVTEMGSICLYQLADVVVFFVAANKQSLDGTKMMAGSLTHKEFQEWRQKRPLRFLFVPSRVELQEGKLQREFKAHFEECFGEFFEAKLKFKQDVFLDLMIPYVPYYAYTEQVAIRDFENSNKAISSSLKTAYERLSVTLAQLAPKNTQLYKSFSEVIDEKSASFSENRYIVDISNKLYHQNVRTHGLIQAPKFPTKFPNLNKMSGKSLPKGDITKHSAHSIMGKTRNFLQASLETSQKAFQKFKTGFFLIHVVWEQRIFIWRTYTNKVAYLIFLPKYFK